MKSKCGYLTYTVQGDTIWVNRHTIDGCRIQKRKDGLWDVVVVHPMVETTGTLSDCLDFAENWFKEDFVSRFESRCHIQRPSARYVTYAYESYLLIVQQQKLTNRWNYQVYDRETNEHLFSRTNFIYANNAVDDFAYWLWDMGGHVITKQDIEEHITDIALDVMNNWDEVSPTRYLITNGQNTYAAVYMTFEYTPWAAGWQFETRDEYGYTHLNPKLYAQPLDVTYRIAREIVWKGLGNAFEFPNLYQWKEGQHVDG